MEKKIIIAQIYENKKSRQKLITIPQKFKNFKAGDYVKIEKIEE